MAELTADDLTRMESLCPGGITRDAELATISQWRIGGRARMIARPSSASQVAALRQFFWERQLPHVVIGETSNLLFADEGLEVPCLQIGVAMSNLRIAGPEVEVQAGIWVPALARRLMLAGLGGAEHICGIPGTLGGLVCMNGGSQRKGIGQSVVWVESVSHKGRIIRRAAAECGFDYRTSAYQTNDEVITTVNLGFTPVEPATIRAEMRAILADRRRKFPRKQPNCGSVFKSNPDAYAEIGTPGAVIERFGFKGMREGGALVSPLHANFIVNTGNAKAADVLTLITRIGDTVENETGHRLEPEVRFVAPDGTILSADHALEHNS